MMFEGFSMQIQTVVEQKQKHKTLNCWMLKWKHKICIYFSTNFKAHLQSLCIQCETLLSGKGEMNKWIYKRYQIRFIYIDLDV